MSYGWLIFLFPIGVVPIVVVVRGLYRRALGVPAVVRRPLSTRSAARGRVALFVFGLVFASAGGAFLFFAAARPAYRALASRHWPTTPGTVLTSRVGIGKSSKEGTYFVDIHYRYRVAGRAYEGTRYDMSAGPSSGRDDKAAVVDRYRPGQRFMVHYDPADPANAVLSTALPADTLMLTLIPSIFLVVGGVIMMLSLRAPGITRAGAAAAGVTSGPVTLSARRGRVVTLIGVAVFATVWCGVVAVLFVAHAPLLFRIVFGGIGGLLLLTTGYQALAVLNPVASVTFPRLPLRPGERVDATFRVGGNFRRLRSLAFRLEGRESATYRVGTSSTTVTHVAWTIPLLDTDRVADMESGRLKLAVPPDAMPTFASANNKFTWFLCCRGTIPKWPDVKDDFAVPVAASFDPTAS